VRTKKKLLLHTVWTRAYQAIPSVLDGCGDTKHERVGNGQIIYLLKSSGRLFLAFYNKLADGASGETPNAT